MIELLILFELNRKILTMYGISKCIKEDFSVLTLPSFGTIKPALKRLENKKFIRTQREISKGGRPSVHYSITDNGARELANLILAPVKENPVQFLTTARVKLACAGDLHKDEQLQLFKMLKQKSEEVLIDVNRLISAKDLSFYPRMVYDNLSCEYKNLITLIEGFEHAGSGK